MRLSEQRIRRHCATVAALDRVVHNRVRGADHLSVTSFSPNGINLGHCNEPRVQDLLNQAQDLNPRRDVAQGQHFQPTQDD